MNLIHILTLCFPKIHFNIILPSTYMSSKWHFPYKFDRNFVYISHVSHLIILDLVTQKYLAKGTNYEAPHNLCSFLRYIIYAEQNSFVTVLTSYSAYFYTHCVTFKRTEVC
jgi:hypothetical protein